MIIKNLAASCRKRMLIDIFTDTKQDIQWIGYGSALYPMHGIPWISTDQALVMFDVPEKKRDKTIVVDHGNIRDFFDVSDGAADNEAVAINLPMFFSGKMIYPTITSQGIAFYDADAFNPVKDIEDLRLYERYTKKGELYFVAKAGMMVEAVILPLNIKAKELLERMTQITDMLKAQVEQEDE